MLLVSPPPIPSAALEKRMRRANPPTRVLCRPLGHARKPECLLCNGLRWHCNRLIQLDLICRSPPTRRTRKEQKNPLPRSKPSSAQDIVPTIPGRDVATARCRPTTLPHVKERIAPRRALCQDHRRLDLALGADEGADRSDRQDAARRSQQRHARACRFHRQARRRGLRQGLRRDHRGRSSGQAVPQPAPGAALARGTPPGREPVDASLGDGARHRRGQTVAATTRPHPHEHRDSHFVRSSGRGSFDLGHKGYDGCLRIVAADREWMN